MAGWPCFTRSFRNSGWWDSRLWSAHLWIHCDSSCHSLFSCHGKGERSTERTVLPLRGCNFYSYSRSSHMASLACKGDRKRGSQAREALCPAETQKRRLDARGQFSSSCHSWPFWLQTYSRTPLFTWRINAPIPQGSKPECPPIHGPGTSGHGESFEQVQLGLLLAQQPINQRTSCPPAYLLHGGVGTRSSQYKLHSGNGRRGTHSSHYPWHSGPAGFA